MWPPYLSDYLRALLRAVWSGFGITDTLVVVIILILAVTDYILGTHYEHPSGVLIAALAVVFILFELCRTSFQLYAGERAERERLQQRMMPQLTPEEPQLANAYIALARDRPQPAKDFPLNAAVLRQQGQRSTPPTYRDSPPRGLNQYSAYSENSHTLLGIQIELPYLHAWANEMSLILDVVAARLNPER